ncbi:hypothetical protein [Gordonia insulae]|uniref:Glycosyltransferase RgtA/B/C/D-like domain-containing protein n=1 Tax=Gordonia insulae TaxID=2420509 RepID=A0A3G8JHD2_9ACTN|nr:hypothetical protein [Gordonia insulae]AZG44404.1 hypothetical protein D7316_00989 [Gordonia insulae]
MSLADPARTRSDVTRSDVTESDLTDAGDGSRPPAASPSSPPRWLRWTVIAVIVAVGLGVRWWFLDVETLDYRAFLSRWYGTLDSQGFGAFREKFADYNYPYLYLLWLLTVLHIPALVGVKAISIAFDLVLAVVAYRIVALRTARYWLRAMAFGIVFLLPSVIANSSYWGQADAIYSACAIGGVYFLMRAQRESLRRNSIWACALFGLALSFKLQAIFVLPVLVWLLIRRRLPWSSLLAIPAVYLLLDIPAVLAGASWSTALSVYLDQTGSYQQLTLGAANLYQLIAIEGDATWLAHLGIGAAAAIIVAFLAWSLWQKPAVSPTSILVVATASAVIVPFLLPAMHDRYFYTAEILSVVTAFYLPLRFVVIPILIQASAIGVYHASLTGDQGQAMVGGPAQGGAGHGGAGHGGAGHGGAGPAGPGPGAPAPGGMHGSGGGYTSGRGDPALSVYASMMGLAALGMVYATLDTFRRARSLVLRSPA